MSAINGNSQNQQSLPEGWQRVTIEDIGADRRNAIVDGPFGSNLKLSDYIDGIDGVPVLTTKNLEKGFENVGLRYISRKKFNELRRSEVVGGDILVAKIGSCGKTGIYPSYMPSAIIPANLLKITVRPSVSRNFVYYYLNSPIFKNYLDGIITATAQPAFSVSKFRKLPLPLPPLPEQERIVSRIEVLFSDLDAGVAALERVRLGLKRYKAAVLKAAIEGRLLDGKARDTEGELPQGWRWLTLPEAGYLSRGKSKHRPRNAAFLYGGPYPFIQTGDIRHADGVISSFTQTYNEAGLAQSKLWPKGTLCITIAANIAETAILGIDACFPDSVVGFVPGKEVESRFVELYFRTIQSDLEKLAPATAQKNINLDILGKIPIPIPPPSEQHQIVAEVERRLSIVLQIEQAVHAGLARAARLRQAVLKAAFEGRL